MKPLVEEQLRVASVLAYRLGDALYLNLTNACTLGCIFCPKNLCGRRTISGFDLRLWRAPTVDEIRSAARAAGWTERSEVVFAGFGEPTHRLAVLSSLIQRFKLARARRIRVDTDGLASLREGRDVVPELVAAGLDAVSVSLNAPDPETYARICPSRFRGSAHTACCEFIRSAVANQLEVTASCVALPGLPEHLCRGLAESLGARFRWRPLLDCAV